MGRSSGLATSVRFIPRHEGLLELINMLVEELLNLFIYCVKKLTGHSR